MGGLQLISSPSSYLPPPPPSSYCYSLLAPSSPPPPIFWNFYKGEKREDNDAAPETNAKDGTNYDATNLEEDNGECRRRPLLPPPPPLLFSLIDPLPSSQGILTHHLTRRCRCQRRSLLNRPRLNPPPPSPIRGEQGGPRK